MDEDQCDHGAVAEEPVVFWVNDGTYYGWMMKENGTLSFYIDFCPFCGEELAFIEDKV